MSGLILRAKLSVVGVGITIACVLLQVSSVSANYKLEDLVDVKCLDPAPIPASNLDQQWMMSVGTWYYLQMSQLDVYQTLSDFMGVEIQDIKDEDVQKSCMKFIWSPSAANLYVRGQQVDLKWTPHANGTFSWKIGNAPAGLATVPFTNNKSYIFIYACWSSGFASWGAMANSKELSQEEVNEIQEYAKSLGFHDKYFMNLNYDTCDDVVGANGA